MDDELCLDLESIGLAGEGLDVSDAENALYPDSMSPAGRPNIRVTRPASTRFPKACPRRTGSFGSHRRAPFTTSYPGQATRSTMEGATEAS